MLKIHKLRCSSFYGFNIVYELDSHEDVISLACMIRGFISIVNDEEQTCFSPHDAYIQTIENHTTLFPSIVYTASYKTINATQEDDCSDYVEFGVTNSEDQEKIKKAHREDYDLPPSYDR